MATFLILNEAKKQELDNLIRMLCGIVPIAQPDGTYILPAGMREAEEYHQYRQFLETLPETEIE